MTFGFLSGSRNFCKLFWVSCEVLFLHGYAWLDPAPRLRIDDCFETRNCRLGPCGLLLSSHRSLQLEVRLHHCVFCTGPCNLGPFTDLAISVFGKMRKHCAYPNPHVSCRSALKKLHEMNWRESLPVMEFHHPPNSP